MLKGWILTVTITAAVYVLTGSPLLAVFAIMAMGIYFSLEVNGTRSR